jgi:3-methyladenine DNA glycosylase Mpg
LELWRSPLLIVAGSSVSAADVSTTARIGITKGADWPLRWHVRGNGYVSRSGVQKALRAVD